MSFKVTHEASGINRLVSATKKTGGLMTYDDLTQTCMKLFNMESFDGCCWMGCDNAGDRITFDCEEEFMMLCDSAKSQLHLIICSSPKKGEKKVKAKKTNKCMAKVMSVSCPKTVVSGSEFTVECCFQNNGAKVWPEQCFWSFIRTKTCDPTLLPIMPLSLSGPIENGQETTVFLRLMAPEVPGTYFWRGRLSSQADGKKKFGQVAKFCVTVPSTEESCVSCESCEKEKCETPKCGNPVPYTEEQKARVDEIRRKNASDPSVYVGSSEPALKAQLVMAKK